MNLSDKNIEESLNYLLKDIQQGLLKNEEDILEEMFPLFDQLSNDEDQKMFKEYVYNNFQNHSFIKHEKLMFQPLMVQEEIEQEIQSENQKYFQQIKNNKDWKFFEIMLQNDEFCTELSIPTFWRRDESIKIFLRNPDVLPKLLELLDLQQQKQNFEYLEQISLWFNLIALTQNKIDQERTNIEQIIGSCLQKQLIQFFDYKAYLKQTYQTEFEEMIKNIQKIQLQQIENSEYAMLESSFQLLYIVQTKVINKEYLDSYFRRIFYQSQQQLNYQQILNQLIVISIQQINIEELYFILTFFFLHQYCNQYNFQTEYQELQNNLNIAKSEERRQQNIISRWIKQAKKNTDLLYQFLFSQLVSIKEPIINQQSFLENCNQYIEKQNLILSKLQQSTNYEIEKKIFYSLNIELLIEVFAILLQLPLIKLKRIGSKDMKIQEIALILSLLHQENLQNIFQLMKLSQNLNLFQCTKLLQENNFQFKNKESMVHLLLLISIHQDYNYENFCIYSNLFKIENSFSKAELIHNILLIIEKEINIDENSVQNVEFLLQYSQNEWLIIQQVLTHKQLSLLLKIFFQIYAQNNINEQQQGNIYQILKQFNQQNLFKGDDSLGLKFIFNENISQEFFNVLFLKDRTLLKNSEYQNKFTLTIFQVLKSQNEEIILTTLGWLAKIDYNNLYKYDLLIKLLSKYQDVLIVQHAWEIIINYSIQNTELLFVKCEDFCTHNPVLYKECFSIQNYFGLSDQILQCIQKKYLEKQDFQEQNLNLNNQMQNLPSQNQEAIFIQNQPFDQNTTIEEPNEEVNQKALEELNNILEDIQDKSLKGDDKIIKEITPHFKQLNKQSKERFKQQLQEQFQGYQFIKNSLFKLESQDLIVEDNQQLFQKLRQNEDWKALLNSFQNQIFCQENQIPQFWSSNECLKLFQNKQFLLVTSLNLIDLNKIENGFNYIELIEIFLILFSEIKKNEKEGLIIAQIIGSTLKVQMLQFQEFQQNLQIIDENQYSRMIEDIQKHQIDSTYEIKMQEYDNRFQTFIKCCTCTSSVQEIELFLNDFFNNNLNQIINGKYIADNLQQIMLQEKLLEDCYFRLIFFFLTSYCTSFNFSNQKLLLMEQLIKYQTNQDRQKKQIQRITQDLIDLNDDILTFLTNTTLHFSNKQIETVYYQQFHAPFYQKQNESEDQMRSYLKKNFRDIVFDNKAFDIAKIHSRFLSLIKANLIFQCDSQIGQKFLLLNYLNKNQKNYPFQQLLQSQEYLKSLESFFSNTNNQELTIYFFILLNEIYKFADPNPQNCLILFKKERTFKKFQFVRDIENLTDETILTNTEKFQNINEVIENLRQLNHKGWLTMELILGYQKVAKVYEIFYQFYIKCRIENNLRTKLYQLLLQLGGSIQNIKSDQNLMSKKFLLIVLTQTQFNFIIVQTLKKQKQLPKKVFYYTFTIIYLVLSKLKENQQIEMVDFLQTIFQNKYFQFAKIKQLLQEKKCQLEQIYYYQMLLFYSEDKNSNEKIITELAFKIFLESSQIYKYLFEQAKYFNMYQIQPDFLINEQTQKLYPKNCEIILEDFNISLSEMNLEEKQILVNKWLENTSDPNSFKQLIPLFFNVIKRKEPPRNLLSLLNRNNNNLKLNMKAMFQILYNNSNQELKSMLLKFWSIMYPIPFLYCNCDILNISKQDEIYCLNEKLLFIFPECFTIINLSLSKNQSSYGKTKLINQIFYQTDIFEVSDKCQLNQNTIDIMFDFCFSGSRDLAIADIHGEIPFDILKKFLPLFQFWIIQMNSEDELEENYQQFLKIKGKDKTQECCFLIRNSKTKQKNEKNSLELQIQNQGIPIHKIIDLTEKDLDSQTINVECEQFSKFIFNQLKRNLDNKVFSNTKKLSDTLLNYYGNSHQGIKQLNNDNKLLNELNFELTKYLKDPQGFYSMKAFPMRSLMRQIKNIKQEQQKCDGLSKEQYQNQFEEKKQDIIKLECQIPQIQPTHLLYLFLQIFQSEEYYILYLKFTDEIRKFNDLNTYNLQEENQKINEELQRKKQDKKNQIEQGQKEVTQAEIEEVKSLKEKQEKNQNDIELRNISIELFWRELIAIKQKGQSHKIEIKPAEIVAKMIKKGEPFEFLDGDQLQIDQNFLLELIKQYPDPEKERVLVLSILGPQSSGKSTILNKIFGCHFWTSVGRCTKGIYLQLIKIAQKDLFENKFDYVLILDSEGLQNPNQTDHEFDKKIALFVLAVSDIILINVKGDIHYQFKNLVEMCIFTLGQMKNSISAVKQLSWCFNQNSACKNYAPFLKQIQGIVKNLNVEVKTENQADSQQNDEKEVLIIDKNKQTTSITSNDKKLQEFQQNDITQNNQEINKVENVDDAQSFDYNEILDLRKESIKILGFASTEKSWSINPNLGIFQEWRQQIVNETFSEEAYKFGREMIVQFLIKHDAEKDYKLLSLFQFIQNIENTWQSICRLPDLLEFTELLQYKQDQSMKSHCEKILKKLDLEYYQIYNKQVVQKIKTQVSKELKKSLEFFKKIEEDEYKVIQFENKRIRNQIEQDLQIFKQKQQILNKIYKKYIRILDEQLKTHVIDCKLIVFEEIKKHEQDFQQLNGFSQIEDYIAEISQNSEMLMKYKSNKQLMEVKFTELWNEITKKQIEHKENFFSQFSESLYNGISSSFAQYQFKTTNFHELYSFFFSICKDPPKVNISQEKEKIFEFYFKEVIQKGKHQQFQLIGAYSKLIKFNNIFHQKLQDRMKRSSAEKNIIDINGFYMYESQYYYVSIQNFKQYLQGELFQNDFSHFLKEDSNNYNHQQCKEKKINKLFQEFFSILTYCNVIYDRDKLELLKKYFIEERNWFEKIWKDKPSQLFKSFQKTFNIQNNIEIVKIIENARNMEYIYQNLKLQLRIINGKNLNEINEKYMQNLNEVKFLIIQQIVPQEGTDEIFQYIANQNQNYQLLNQYNKLIVDSFYKIMIEQSGWKTIYFQIYDIIKQKMIKIRNYKNEDSNDSDNEEVLSSDNYLVKAIMFNIEQKIIEYNMQFADFGIILSMIGERCIYYYSIFIIWRFSCFNKWQQLGENNQNQSQMRVEQLRKFIAAIEQNKREQSILYAQALANSFKHVFLDKFYQDQLTNVSDSIQIMNKKSCDLVKFLDQKLLQNYETAKQQKISEEKILQYILDQKSFIQRYVEDEVLKKEEEIRTQYQNQLREELYQFLIEIKQNVYLLYFTLKKQTSELKSEKYFEINDNDTNRSAYDQKLFLLIQSCIQGRNFQNVQINSQYAQIFNQQYQKIEVDLFSKLQNDSKKIPLLKPYIEELYNKLELEIKACKNEPLNLTNLLVQKKLNEVKLNMIGCLYTCPMCRRKCDQQSTLEHQHICSNGHQYRGMNGVLIENWPSLYTCEEINDNALITTLETNQIQRWKDIKKAYSEWNFHYLNLSQTQKLNEKMMDIWNSGTGQLICGELTKKLKKTIQFEKKTEFNQEKQSLRPTHYVLMLDDSFSMKGQPWTNAKNAALSAMQVIKKNGEANVSVIAFNSIARVIIDCQKVDIANQQDLIIFQGGLTNFNEAFSLAYDQITKHFNKKFERNIILFYTDGGDQYPNEAVSKFCQLSLAQRQTIQLISCAEGNFSESSVLNKLTYEFTQALMLAELKNNIKNEDLGSIWSEVVIKSYHQLKC